MKRVKIFLASSIEDLWEDRLQVGDFFRQLNEIYLDSGIHFSLVKCEDYDNSIAAGGKQQEYDREIRESELVFFLFFRKIGDYTRHELEIALEAFKDQKKPRIVTYFKYINSIDEAVQEVRDFMQLLDREMKHYYNTYGNIDTLKLGILMQIKLMKLDSSQIKLEDGAVLLNGQSVVKSENVPLLHGNQVLRELTEKRRQLQVALQQFRQMFLAEPTPENEAAFFDTSAALNRVSKQLTEVEQETMVLLTTVSEMTTDGRVLTYRQKEALKYFNQGDYAAVHAILEDVERENELRRAQQRAEVAKNEIQGYVEEELLLINTEKAQGLTKERVDRIMTSYQKLAVLVEKYDLDRSVFYEYAAFLSRQNQHAQAITVAEKLSWYYADPSMHADESDKAALYNLLGGLYCDTDRYREAEDSYGKALDIISELAARSPDDYEPKLAKLNENLGILHTKTKRYGKAKEALGKALEIHTRLAARNPDTYEAGLASCYNHLGILYRLTWHYERAEEVYKKALEIHIRLAARNPEVNERVLAMSYNNLGNFYHDTKQYWKAEEVHRKALEIRIRLAARNPDAYEPNVATSYYNLGNLFCDTQCYEEAEEVIEKALEIRIRLAARNPDTYESDLANSYYSLGFLLYNVQRYAEAEKAFHKAIEIFRRLAARNPDIYERELADVLWNLALIYKSQGLGKKMVEVFRTAQPLYEKMALKYPDIYCVRRSKKSPRPAKLSSSSA